MRVTGEPNTACWVKDCPEPFAFVPVLTVQPLHGGPAPELWCMDERVCEAHSRTLTISDFAMAEQSRRQVEYLVRDAVDWTTATLRMEPSWASGGTRAD